MPSTDTQAEELTDLGNLATELSARGYRAALRAPAGRLPYLDVTNPRASILTEKIYAQAGAFWYSWAEKIADCDDLTTAADTLARVLRTADAD